MALLAEGGIVGLAPINMALLAEGGRLAHGSINMALLGKCLKLNGVSHNFLTDCSLIL